MFNKVQLNELWEKAEEIVCHKKWNELPWDDAWSGKYPIDPIRNEVDLEFDALRKKAERMIKHGPSINDYETLEDQVRTISLEFCETFDLYQAKPRLNQLIYNNFSSKMAWPV